MREAGGLCTHGSLGRFVRSFLKEVLFYCVDIVTVTIIVTTTTMYSS